jgi:hypothetical protein
MVKKNYVAPASNEACTRLRASLLVGSGTGSAIINGTGDTDQVTSTGNAPIDGGNGQIGDARRRSVSSVD